MKENQVRVLIAVVHIFITINGLKDSASSVAFGVIFIYDFSEQS